MTVAIVRSTRPGSLIVRAAALQLLSAAANERPSEIRKRWPSDVGLDLVAKAAATAGSVDSWGASLLAEEAAGLFDLLASRSVFGALGAAGARVQFRGRNTIGLPERTATSRATTAFVGEAAPVPASELSFAALSVARYKFGSLSVATTEILSATLGELEAFVERAILDDMSRALDAALLDATETDGTRPSGLLFGVTPTASAGATVANVDADIAALLGEFTGSETSELRIVMHPVRRRNLALKRGTGGAPAYPELAGGTLAGVEVLESANASDSSVIMLNARNFVAGFDGPAITQAQDVAVHVDTAATALSAAGTPNVVAAPVVSAWQQELAAIRVILPAGWALRTAGSVAALSGVAW